MNTNPACSARTAFSVRRHITTALREVRLDIPRTAIAQAATDLVAKLAATDLAPYADQFATRYLAAIKDEPVDVDRGKVAAIVLAELVLDTYRGTVVAAHGKAA